MRWYIWMYIGDGFDVLASWFEELQMWLTGCSNYCRNKRVDIIAAEDKHVA